jgi:soluble P-type ATPase
MGNETGPARFDIPGFGVLNICHLVCDYNGTLAEDGRLISGVAELLPTIAQQVVIHVITADTFGLVRQQLSGLPCTCTVLPPEDQARAKEAYIRSLDAASTMAIGNGRNDRFMVREAALGIVVINGEGVARETLLNADVVCDNILDALAFFTEPRRLVATLRE